MLRLSCYIETDSVFPALVYRREHARLKKKKKITKLSSTRAGAANGIVINDDDNKNDLLCNGYNLRVRV